MEPLIWQWYAWPHLIFPVTAGCNILERHLKIMESFVQNPLVHQMAVKDPKLLGGPFADLKIEQVDMVKDLIKKTKEHCKELITLATSYKELDLIMKNQASGDSIQSLYDKIPLPLKGMVELVYDLNNNPSIRLIETLIYKKYYSSSWQSIALSECKSDFRKFVLSTPRFDYEEEQICLNLPFSDPRLDILFKMKTHPNDIDYIINLFEIPHNKKDTFIKLFTPLKPDLPINRNYRGNGIRLRYFGHACILIETSNLSILFDPVISYQIESDSGELVERFTYDDLPEKIDYIILTHNHQDHVLFETLLQLRYKIINIIIPASQIGSLADPSMKLMLKHLGFSSILEVKEFETIKLPDGEINSIPFLGEHSDLNIQSKMAYIINLKSKKFMFAADSNNLDPIIYDHIFEEVGPIDTLFLGMECEGAPLSWLYGPLLTQPLKREYDRKRNLSGSNADKAWSMTERSGCRAAYIYAMGQEPWLNFVMALKYEYDSLQIQESEKFIKTCESYGIRSERLFGKKEWVLDE